MSMPDVAPIPAPARLDVAGAGLLDDQPADAFDGLADLAAKLLRAPYAFVTLAEATEDGRTFPATGSVAGSLEHALGAYLVSEGAPVVVGDVSHHPFAAADPAIRAMGIRGWAGYPLLSRRGQVLGALCVADTQVRSWTGQDVEVLRVLAQAAARELALREAMARSQLANDKLKLLSDVGHALAETRDVRQAVVRLARMVVPLLGDWSIVSVIDSNGELVDRGWWHGDETDRAVLDDFVGERLRGIGGRGATYEARDSRLPVVVTEDALERGLAVLQSEAARAAFRRLNPASYATFPLVAGGRVHGVLSVVRSAGRPPMTETAIEVAVGIATRAGLALENARLFEAERTTSEHLAVANAQILASGRHDRVVARALQDALLTRLPPSDTLEFAARYLTAGGVDQVGGDFYDAIPAGASTTLVVGDICGHDIEAAAVMGQVRNMLRALAWTHPNRSPGEQISLLDKAIRDFAINRMATLTVLRIERDPATRAARVTWSNAGHLPPAVLRPDGTVELLVAPADHPLGVRPDRERHDHQTTLPAGSVLLFYTDGLVETRIRDVDTGLRLLQDSLAGLAGTDLDTIVDGVLGVLIEEEPADDVAVFAARLI